MVTREAACCPFLSYEVVSDGDHVVWTTTGPGASDLVIVDEFVQAPGEPADSALIAAEMTDRDGIPVIVPADGGGA